MWCDDLTPPSGLVGMGAVRTVRGFYRRCPSCDLGWCLLAPSAVEPYGYFLDALRGCGRGCHPSDIARLYHVTVLANLPPLATPNTVLARKMRGRARDLLRALAAGLPGAPSPPVALAEAAKRVGAACAIGELDEDVLLDALFAGGRHLGLAEETVQRIAVDGFAAGWNDAWGLR